MKIIHRHKVNVPMKGDKYLATIVSSTPDQVLVRAHVKGDVTITEIVLFEDTFEGKPAMGGLFVLSEGDKPEFCKVEVKEWPNALH